MAEIINYTGKPLIPEATMNIPAMELPSFRTHMAIQRGVANNILVKTMGGIGDYITAEPAIRYAIEKFKGMDISIATECPDFFGHLKVKKIYDLMKETPDWEKYLVFKSLWDPAHLHGEFVAQMLTQCVDYSSLSMWRCQVPVKDRHIVLTPNEDEKIFAKTFIHPETDVVLHPGLTWKTKTFPGEWWNEVIKEIIALGKRPVLIGFNFAESRGCVSVDATHCLNLINCTSRMQTVAILQECKVFITNDSAPLHMAASGDAWIGFISTAKHPDFVTHWRHGQWGWKMKSLGMGSLWEVANLCPSYQEKVDFSAGDISSYIPEPRSVGAWGVSCL